MSIFKYNDYIIDNSLDSLLELKLLYSDKFIKILNRMQDNKIAETLLKLYKNDIETKYNYIDVTKDKELVSFTPDRKAQEIIKSRPELWQVVRVKHLTDNDENDLIFAALGYDKHKIKSWKPEKGSVGIILAETISEETGRTYCLWQELDPSGKIPTSNPYARGLREVPLMYGHDLINDDDIRRELMRIGDEAVDLDDPREDDFRRRVLARRQAEERGIAPGSSTKTKKTLRVSVLNKEGFQQYVSSNAKEDAELWKSSARTDIRIGRMVRAILSSLNIETSDKEIEEFTNQYKATFDFLADKLKQFDVVNGDKIAYWYNYQRYLRREGVLGNSCMSGKPANYFDLYTKNPDACSLVILYDDDGKIDTKGKYTSSKIKGRALLWRAELNGKAITLLDRIYTMQDADYQLFLTLAKENGWTPRDTIRGTLNVRLQESKFNRYPYVDTLSFLEPKLNIISNTRIGRDENRYLHDTDGGYNRG